MSYIFLRDDVIGYISHPKVLSSWVIVFWPYHKKWGEVLSNALFSLHPWASADVFAAQQHLFACKLLPRRPGMILLWILMSCLSLLPLSHDASPPVLSMENFNSQTSKLVKYVEFSKAPCSSNFTPLTGCFSLLNVVRMKWMMQKGDRFDAVGNNQSIIVFVHKIVSMEVNPPM